jgi:HAD superfamily hydrolase (TIGR01549 family)
MIEKASGFGIPAAEYEGQDSRMALIFNKTREFAIRNGFSKEKASTIIESLNRIVAEAEGQEHEGSMPLPGALETLEALKRSGYRIGIVTNTCESELLKMLERFGFKRYIDFHVTRDDVEYLKPHPQPVLKILEQSGTKDFCYIGDADHDLEAARSASRLLGTNCMFILINTRGYDKVLIAAMGPDKVIDSLEELQHVLIGTE